MSSIDLLASLPEEIVILFVNPDLWERDIEIQLQQLKQQDPDTFRDVQLSILYRTITALNLAFVNTFATHLAPEVCNALFDAQEYIEKHMTYQHFQNMKSHPLIVA